MKLIDVKTQVGNILKASPLLVPLIGNKVYASMAPQGTDPPYISFSVSGSEDLYSHSGNEGVGSVFMEFEIVGGKSVAEIETIRDALQEAIEEFAGTDVSLSSGPIVRFGGIFLRSEIDLYDAATFSYRKSIDFDIHFSHS